MAWKRLPLLMRDESINIKGSNLLFRLRMFWLRTEKKSFILLKELSFSIYRIDLVEVAKYHRNSSNGVMNNNNKKKHANYILLPDLTPGFNGLSKDKWKTRRDTSKFWDLVRLISKIWQYVQFVTSYLNGWCVSHVTDNMVEYAADVITHNTHTHYWKHGLSQWSFPSWSDIIMCFVHTLFKQAVLKKTKWQKAHLECASHDSDIIWTPWRFMSSLTRPF